MREKIYFWACDYSENSGEGILGRSYIKYLTKNNKNFNLININKHHKYQKKNRSKKNDRIFKSIKHKYFYPLYGILNLWKLYFSSKKVLYLNYLPLWNFLIFLLLPPKSLIGPITGTIIKYKYSLINYFFERLSLLLINLRFNKVIFSNNFFKFKYELKEEKYEFNFILSDFKKRKRRRKKLYDFVIYYRNLSNEYNFYIYELIKLLKEKFKIVIIGDYIKINNIKNYGFISRRKATDIISKSRYAINNPENLYSYFFQDCMSYDLKIFYNKIFRKYNKLKNKKLIPISNTKIKKDYLIIRKNCY
ncbi:hypothetical protein OA187_04385 [Candidatus Pelagibacter sp.]|nr:hypothetical protein [Candidatus Pelagibacter sp.]